MTQQGTFTVTAKVIETGEVLVSYPGLREVRAETRQDTLLNRYDTRLVYVTITPDA